MTIVYTVMAKNVLFIQRTTEELIWNYYRRFKRSRMKKTCIKGQGVKTFKQIEDVYIFFFLPKYHIFSFSTALQKLQKIVTCFPKRKIK